MFGTPAPDVARMFLARHGATAANEQRPFVLQGCEIDGSLTETGRSQAALLAEFMARYPLKAAYSSSLKRARETAAVVAERHQLSVEPLADLRECSVGRWEGLDWGTIQRDRAKEWAAFSADPANVPHPGGESYADVLARVEPALRRIFERHLGQSVLVVAHNLVNRIYLAGLVGIPLRDARRLKQSNTGVNILEFQAGKVELITLNSVLHLER